MLGVQIDYLPIGGSYRLIYSKGYINLSMLNLHDHLCPYPNIQSLISHLMTVCLFTTHCLHVHAKLNFSAMHTNWFWLILYMKNPAIDPIFQRDILGSGA